MDEIKLGRVGRPAENWENPVILTEGLEWSETENTTFTETANAINSLRF